MIKEEKVKQMKCVLGVHETEWQMRRDSLFGATAKLVCKNCGKIFGTSIHLESGSVYRVDLSRWDTS